MASSFGCMSALTARMHRHLLSRFATEASSAGEAVRGHTAALGIDAAQQDGGLGGTIPANPTLEALPGALAAAHKCYGKQDAVVLFVVQPGETNAMDQRLLELQLWDNHGVRVVRMSLAEVRCTDDAAFGARGYVGRGVWCGVMKDEDVERRLPRRLSVGSDSTWTDYGAPKHRHGFVKS